MKLDKFLAALFSKKTLILILVITLAVFSLSACTFTLEDVFCLFFCGVPSLSTCREWVMNCDCDCTDGTISTPDGERVDCNRSNCIGESYNGCFGCIWEAGLKDCSPSKMCAACSDGEE